MASPNTIKLQGPDPKKRLVSVLHKLHPGDGGKENDRELAVGHTFTFPRSKASYLVMPSGAVTNTEPKLYLSKADKKAMKRERRRRREANA